MASTRASISKASKRPKINIIPPKQLFVDLTHDDSKTPSPKHQLSSSSAPNAPSKTPSTKGTSSSSIDYTPKSPTSSTSPSTNGYLNSPTSPPPRVPSPPPTQENTSMDITLTLSPITPLDAPLGYRAAEIGLSAASPSTHHPSEIPSPPLLLPSIAYKDDLPEMDMPLWKRACFTAPTGRFEVGESLSAAAARQTGHTLAHRIDYGFVDTLDASIRASESKAMTVVGEVNERVIDLAISQRQDAQELYMRYEDAQDDRALLRAQISILTR
ncbi:hypothetical protein Tco_1371465 [Tanacetum coccineum]